MNGLPGLDVVRSISLYGLSDVRLVFKDGTDNYFARRAGVRAAARRGRARRRRPRTWLRCSRPRGWCTATSSRAPTAPRWSSRRSRTGCSRRPTSRCPASPICRGSAARRCSTRSLLDPTRLAGAGLSVPGGRRRRWAPTTATPAADSTPRAGSSTTCAAWAASQRPRTSARSSSRSRTGPRSWCRTSARSSSATRPGWASSASTTSNDAVEGVVLMRTGEQAQTVLKGVEAEDGELNAIVLPKDVRIVPFYDRSDLIRLTTRTVEDNLLRGILLVDRGPDLLPVRRPVGAHRRRDDPAVAALRLHLPRSAAHPGQPALHRRHRFRHPGATAPS